MLEGEGGHVLFGGEVVERGDRKDALEIVGDRGILEQSQVFVAPVAKEGAPSLSGEGVTADQRMGSKGDDGYLFFRELDGLVEGRGGLEPYTTVLVDHMERDEIFPERGGAQEAGVLPVGEAVEIAMDGVGGEDMDAPGGMMAAPGVEGVLLLLLLLLLLLRGGK